MPRRPRAGRRRPGRAAPHPRRDGDDLRPSVVRVGGAPGQAALLEGVDDVGDRARRDPQVLRELAEAHRAVVREHAQRPGVVRREVVGLEGHHPAAAQVAGDAHHEVAEVEVGGGAVVAGSVHAGNGSAK